MKTWKVTFWRSNPQLANGGYQTTRTIEAKTRNAAMRKAEKIARDCIYGGMTPRDIEEIKN